MNNDEPTKTPPSLNQLGMPAEDIAAPNLKSFSVDNYNVDLSKGNVTLKSTFQISDDLSGFDWGQIYWESPSGEQQLFGGNIDPYTLTSGDANNGIYTIFSNELNQYSENGEWSIRDGFLKDKSGNTFQFDDADLNESGFKTTLNITGGVQDSSAPEFKSFSIDNYNVDLSKGNVTLKSTFQISDDLSGFDWGQIYWESPSGEQQLFGGNIDPYTLTSGDANNGIYTISSNELNQYSENGEWSIRDGFLRDKSGNTFQFDNADLNESGFKTTLNITGGVQDSFAPELKSFSVDNYNVDLSKGNAILKSTFQISDDLSGFDWGQIYWESPSGEQQLFGGNIDPYTLTSGDANNGIYTISSNELNQYSENGEWSIREGFLRDKTGNTFQFDDADLEALGIKSTLNIFSNNRQQLRNINNAKITLDQRHTDTSGGDYLKLGYALKGNDNTGNPGGEASTLGINDDGLTNVAVLGPNTSSANSYTLEISGESLKEGWNLESADIVLKYNAELFNSITAADITLASELPIKNAVSIDDKNGLIRFAAASLGDLSQGSAIFGENILASINVNFDESYFNDDARNPNPNGKFTFAGNPLGFELAANSDETIFSRTFDSDTEGKEVAGGAYTNREIKSLGDLNGGTTFDKNDINLYQAEIKFDEQDGGLTFGTNRVIGANQGFTNLIRKGDTVTAQTSIENVGNSLAKDVNIQDAGNVDNAKFVTSRFIKKSTSGDTISITSDENIDLNGGLFSDSRFIHEGDELPTAVAISGNSLATWDSIVYANGINYVDGYNFTSSAKGNTAQFTVLEPGSQSRDLAEGDYMIRGHFARGPNVFTKNLSGSDAFLFQFSGGDLSNPANFTENSVVFLGQEFTDVADFSYDFKAGYDERIKTFDFSYNSDSQESVNIEVDMKATGAAGSVIDVTKGLFQVTAAGMNQNPDTKDTPDVFVSESGSKNLITFQGDLNYDGRVSMKDLAFLNAGAARQVENNGVIDAASVARDVDADFSGKIDIADLSILDNDWGKSLHTGTEDFTGSSASLDWTTLEKQGDATWDNSSFTAQNAIEAQDSYIGSLDAPASTGVIGTDGNTASNDGDIQGTEVQDSFAA